MINDISEQEECISNLIWDYYIKGIVPSNPIIQQQPRTRGRPKCINKIQLPTGLNVHLMENDINDNQSLTVMTKRKIQADFKKYILEGKSPNFALNKIARLYEISYRQAFSVTEKV